MAKVKEISVECSYLKSLPNYENVRLTAGVVLTVEKGDDSTDVYNKAWDTVGEQIEEQLKLFQSEDQSKIKKGLK